MGLKSFFSLPFAKYVLAKNSYWKNNAVVVQKNLLFSLIKTAKKTQFGREHDFNKITSYSDWKKHVPIRDYEGLKGYIQQIINALKDEAPVIAFGKGCWFALNEMSKSGASALGIDWTCSARNARYLTGGNITLQGNFDPTRLYSPPSEIKKMVTQMINEFGKDKYIVNLGHGILPNIPLENAKAFIDAVKDYRAE